MAVKNFFDAVIVGGGASGLMCAISAKQHKKDIKIAIIEKNDRVGKKLLSTGNGRCNLTNKNISSELYTGSFKAQSHKIFSRFTTDYLLSIFKNLGLLTFYDNEGRIYPISKQASSVLDVLRFACERLEVEIFCSENIKSVKKSSDKFYVATDNYNFVSDKLVLACGSKAAPKLGGNASGSDYLKNFGHRVIPFSPALCAVNVKSNVLKSLKGLRATGKATLIDNKGNILKTEIGEIQFTDKSLSGICVFNLSLYTQKECLIALDLLPGYSEEELCALLEKQRELFFDLPCEYLLTGIFQKRLTQAILKMSGITDFSKLCNLLNNNEITKICDTVKNMVFPVIGNEDFSNAQCALGGVYGKEINENTMESKITKNLYICGEAIDLCGECGGYNLHFAFSSGYLVGENL